MDWTRLVELSPVWGPFLIALALVLGFAWKVIRLLGNDLVHALDKLRDSIDTLNGNIQRLLGRGDKL